MRIEINLPQRDIFAMQVKIICMYTYYFDILTFDKAINHLPKFEWLYIFRWRERPSVNGGETKVLLFHNTYIDICFFAYCTPQNVQNARRRYSIPLHTRINNNCKSQISVIMR